MGCRQYVGPAEQGIILILNKDLKVISMITESRTLFSITFDEEGNAYIGGKRYILQYDKNGRKLREADFDGDIYKIIYVNGFVIALATSQKKDQTSTRHDIAIFTKDLELVLRRAISPDLQANFIFDSGKVSVHNNDIYLVGSIKYPNGTSQWIIYSVKLIYTQSQHSLKDLVLKIEIKEYISKLIELVELETEEFWNIFYYGLRASRIGEELSKGIERYISRDMTEVALAKIIEKAISSTPDLFLYSFKKLKFPLEYIELVEEASRGLDIGLFGMQILNIIVEYRLRKDLYAEVYSRLADEYIARLVKASSKYLPLDHCIVKINLQKGDVELEYSETCLNEWIEHYVSRLSEERKMILLEYLNFLNTRLTSDLVEYPLSNAPPLKWHQKIVKDVELGIDILGHMEFAYTVSSFLTSWKTGKIFDWVSLIWEIPNEYNKEELKYATIYATVGVSWIVLEKRIIWYRGYFIKFLLEHFIVSAEISDLRANLNKWKEIETLVTSLRGLNITVLYYENIGGLHRLSNCYIGSNTYRSQFLSYGYYVASLSTLQTLLNQLGTFERHEALIYCPPAIRSKVIFNPDVKPKVEIERVRLSLSLHGHTLFYDLSISNPYPFEINITTATYPSILEAGIFIPLRTHLQVSRTFAIPPYSTIRVSVPASITTFLITSTLRTLLTTDIFVNNAFYGCINPLGFLSGRLIVFSEAQNKLYVTIITDDGRIVGYRDRDIVVEKQDAQFVDMQNCIQIAYLPDTVNSFKIVVDSKDAHYSVESYNISIISLAQQNVLATTIKANISKGEIHQLEVRIEENNTIVIRSIGISKDKFIIEGDAVVMTSPESQNNMQRIELPPSHYMS